MNISTSFDENFGKIQIAPLLFIPFVENAFKHSKIEDKENGKIEIELKYDSKKKQLHFRVENTVPSMHFEKDKVGGIGLTNVMKRLEILYPSKHKLDIFYTKDTYIVDLKLDV